MSSVEVIYQNRHRHVCMRVNMYVCFIFMNSLCILFHTEICKLTPILVSWVHGACLDVDLKEFTLGGENDTKINMMFSQV